MIYLVLAMLSSCMVSVCMRFAEKKSQYPLGLLASNYLICSIMAMIYCDQFQFSLGLGAFGFLNGLAYLIAFILIQWNIRNNGMIMTSTFNKLGVTVPVLASMLLFHENPTLTQCLGMILAGLSIFLLKGKSEQKPMRLLPLVVLLFMGGFTDFTSKIFEMIFDVMYKDVFLFLTFFSAMLFCVVYVLMKKQKITGTELFYGALIGLPNYYSARFLLHALTQIDAIVVYPTCSVGTILMVSVFGFLFFGEKLTKRQVFIMGLILISLILLNLS